MFNIIGVKMKKIILVLLFLIISLLNLYANDGSGTILPTGDVQFKDQTGIKMDVEALYIKPIRYEKDNDRIHGFVEVNYIFKNITENDITTEVFFPLPEMETNLDYGEYIEHAQFHDFDFQLYVNGKQKDYNVHFEIWSGTDNVTNVLTPIYKTYYDCPSHEDYKEYIKTLSEKDRNYIESIFDRMPQNWEKYSLKKKVYFYWTQTFPANNKVHIKHTYIAQQMSNNLGFLAGYSYIKDNAPFDEMEYVAGYYHKEPLLCFNGYFQYILLTANKWSRPIKSFNLLVEGPERVAVRFEDNPELSKGRLFAKNILNFSPTTDLYVEFASKNFFKDEIYETKEDIGEYFFSPETKSWGYNTIGTIVASSQIAKAYDHDATKAHEKSIIYSNAKLYKIDTPANLREKPNGKIIKSLEGDIYAWILENKNDWYKVAYNEMIGWIYKDNLIDIWDVLNLNN